MSNKATYIEYIFFSYNISPSKLYINKLLNLGVLYLRRVLQKLIYKIFGLIEIHKPAWKFTTSSKVFPSCTLTLDISRQIKKYLRK